MISVYLLLDSNRDKSVLSEYLNLSIRFFLKYLFFGIAHLPKP